MTRPGADQSSALGRGLGVVAAAGLGALAWGCLVERHWYALRHHVVGALAPGTGRRLRILHLSDLHLLPWQDRRAAFVRSCRDTAPDLVVATGDLLGHPSAIALAVAALGDVAEGLPALAVLGSNDFFGPTPRNPLRYFTGPSGSPAGCPLNTEALVDGLRGRGWLVLENDRATIETAAGPVDAVGLGDPHIGRDRPERVDWSSSDEPAVLRLGVVHAPYLRALNVLADHSRQLILAGHTHGGQVRVPGFGALVTNCDLPRGQARGVSRHRGAWLHVSAGLGHSMYAPVRFSCRPEATVLDVV